MSHRIIFLWTVPRSVSTSFERMMTARGDHTVFDEPFSRAYYFGPDRRSSRFSDTLPESSADDVLETLEKAPLERPVFVKDMAYQAATVLNADLLKRFDNCFLVRHPAATLRSLARTGRTSPTRSRVGPPRRGSAHRRVTRAAAHGPRREGPVRNPPTVVAEWCDRMGLPYDVESLTGSRGCGPTGSCGVSGTRRPRAPPVSASCATASPPTSDEPRLHEAYQAALSVYGRLAADAIGTPSRRGSGR